MKSHIFTFSRFCLFAFCCAILFCSNLSILNRAQTTIVRLSYVFLSLFLVFIVVDVASCFRYASIILISLTNFIYFNFIHFIISLFSLYSPWQLSSVSVSCYFVLFDFFAFHPSNE